MIKLLIGGSPCTYWSIAKKNNRETEAEGMGWELFKNYLIAKEKFKPDFFLYENNKSAAQAIKDQIKKELKVWDGMLLMEDTGARYIEINSALVSAQNRQRFYVHNCGEVEQPEDRGILLKDILEYKSTGVAENVGDCETIQKAIPKLVEKYGYLSEQFNAYNLAEIDEKSPTLSTGSMVTSSCATTKFERCAMFSPPHGWNEGLITYKKSHTLTTRSGKQQTNVIIQKASEGAQIIQGEKPLKLINQVYAVKDGLITIKGKQYPIKLADGYYIIRKLTVTECARLQTMPDDYCRAVSNAQAYKGLGNGWTAEVIIHILNGALKDVPKDEEIVVLSMYDGIGTGRYCLDKMGFTNVKYYAYEIDKYAMQVALSNYPDIIECGDAFAVRNKNWSVN